MSGHHRKAFSYYQLELFTKKMLVLTGTSGRLGGGVLQNILQKGLMPPSELVISAFNVDGVPAAAKDAGIIIQHGDYTKPETLLHAFRGADALFLVTYPSVGEERFEHHKAAIDAAKASGIRHVIYTSLSFGGITGEESIAGVMQAHVRSVKYLKASGLIYTIVREASYADIWNIFCGFVQLDASHDDVDFVVPGDGASTWADRDELAEATASIVANWKQYENKSILLSGPRATSISEIATLLQTHTGRQVNVKIVSPEEAIIYHMRNPALPQDGGKFLRNWATWFKAMSLGEASVVDPALEQLLGRKPKGIQEMAEELFVVQQPTGLDTKEFGDYAK